MCCEEEKSGKDSAVVRFVLTLLPHTVLYIPPLWVHHVTALEASLSVSVWSPHVAIELAGKVGAKGSTNNNFERF